MGQPRILSVGQCGYDHSRIARQLGPAVGAEVEGADTSAEALERLRAGPFDLVLVNRVGDLDGAPGLDLIRALRAEPGLASVPVMLVSDLADAQADASSLGALPGFGKSSLSDPATLERIAAALGRAGDGPIP